MDWEDGPGTIKIIAPGQGKNRGSYYTDDQHEVRLKFTNPDMIETIMVEQCFINIYISGEF